MTRLSCHTKGNIICMAQDVQGADNIDEGRQFWCYISEDLENWSEPGMMFHGFDGRMYFALHQPNHAPMERPYFFEIVKAEDGYALIGRK